MYYMYVRVRVVHFLRISVKHRLGAKLLHGHSAWWRLVELRRAVKAKVAKLLGGMLNATFGGWARWA